jgi:hypothetical protein
LAPRGPLQANLRTREGSKHPARLRCFQPVSRAVGQKGFTLRAEESFLEHLDKTLVCAGQAPAKLFAHPRQFARTKLEDGRRYQMDDLLRTADMRDDEVAVWLIEHCAQPMLDVLKFFEEAGITTSFSSHQDNGSD